jgi:hypothetical protein
VNSSAPEVLAVVNWEYIHVHSINIYTGHPREIWQGGTRLLWSFVA